LLPTLALLVLAQSFSSMPLLLLGMALGGIAAALGYRGSLQVVNEIAPAVLSRLSTPVAASSVFAVTIALFVVTAILTSRKFTS